MTISHIKLTTLYKISFLIMVQVNMHIGNIHNIFILQLSGVMYLKPDHEIVGINGFVISLSCIISEIYIKYICR